jgi:hypothetical protein
VYVLFDYSNLTTVIASWALICEGGGCQKRKSPSLSILRSPYAFTIEYRHTFLILVVYALAVEHLDVLLKFPSFLDTAYLSSSSPCGSVAGSTDFTLSFPLFRPLTHLSRRALVIYCLGLVYKKPAPDPVKGSLRHLRSIPPLFSLFVSFLAYQL